MLTDVIQRVHLRGMLCVDRPHSESSPQRQFPGVACCLASHAQAEIWKVIHILHLIDFNLFSLPI